MINQPLSSKKRKVGLIMSEIRVLDGFVLGLVLGAFASEYLGFKLFRTLVTVGEGRAVKHGGTTTQIGPTSGTDIVPKIPTPAPQQLGRLSKLPFHIRRRVWRLLVHKVDDYISFDSRPAGILRKDKNKTKIPTMLLVSRVLANEFAVELYSMNEVLRFPIDPQNKSWTWQNCHPFGPKALADFSRFEKLRVEIYAPQYRTWTHFAAEAWLTQITEGVWGLEWLFMEKFRVLKMAQKKCPRVELAFLGAENDGGVGRWWKESPSALAPITGKEFDQDERAEVSELLRALNKRYLSVGVEFVLDPILDHELACAHRARELLKKILEG